MLNNKDFDLRYYGKLDDFEVGTSQGLVDIHRAIFHSLLGF